jgi:hypothetical protein
MFRKRFSVLLLVSNVVPFHELQEVYHVYWCMHGRGGGLSCMLACFCCTVLFSVSRTYQVNLTNLLELGPRVASFPPLLSIQNVRRSSPLPLPSSPFKFRLFPKFSQQLHWRKFN